MVIGQATSDPPLTAFQWFTDWLLKPAVGALALWLWTLGKRQYQNYKFRKRHAITGPYIGYVKGTKDGAEVTEKEVLTLRQSISKVTGTAETVDHQRSWEIDAEILDDGHVSGRYTSRNAADNSRGTFFLEPKLGKAGEYEGVWAGYDANHRMVKSDSYNWRKVMETRILRLKDDNSKYKALAILQVSLGKKYIDEPSFQQYLRGLDTRIGLGAWRKKELVGVGLAKIMEDEDFALFDPAAKQAGAKISLSAYGRVGHVRSIAIAEEFRGSGVGTRLCLDCVEHLKEEDCTAVFTVAWEAPDQFPFHSPTIETSGPSLRMLRTAGFTPIASIKEFWRVDDPLKDHQCPRCGFPCRCTAVFCVRQL